MNYFQQMHFNAGICRLNTSHPVHTHLKPQKSSRTRHRKDMGRRVAEDTAPTLSPARKRAFLAVIIAFPFILLGSAELVLRLMHYGPNLSLFTTAEVHGTTFHVLNHEVKARYFSGIHFSPTTALDYFKVPKPPGTFRIFTLGGSTAVGYPYNNNASFSSFLRDRLRRIFPERKIEVINLGMTATNSFTVLDLARELPAYQPDLLLVYDGHNEFYGGLGVNSRGLLGGSRGMTMLYLQMLHSRLFVLLRDTYDWLRSIIAGQGDSSARDVSIEVIATGQRVPYGSPVYREAELTFKENLADLQSLCREHSIPLLLSSQVSNLRGQPPFASEESQSLSAGAKSEFTAHQRAGKASWEGHRWDTALAEYRAASALDSLHAGVHFAIARCLDVLGRNAEAHGEYIKARDYDELRFRTSSDFNDLIKESEDGTTVGTVDIEKLFSAYSPDSLIGNELILDHVHPNSFGYFLMAKGYAAAMRSRGILASADLWGRQDTINDRVLWDERPVTELDERIAIQRTALLTSGWPFSEPSLSVPRVSPRDTLEQFARRVTEGGWGAGDAHWAAATLYEKIGDSRKLDAELRALISLDPTKLEPYITLGKLFVAQNRLGEARTILERAIQVDPTPDAFRLLGDIALRTGDAVHAVTWFQKALGVPRSPDDAAEDGYRLAVAYIEDHQPDRAEFELRHVLSVRPSHHESILLLDKILREKQTRR